MLMVIEIKPDNTFPTVQFTLIFYITKLDWKLKGNGISLISPNFFLSKLNKSKDKTLSGINSKKKLAFGLLLQRSYKQLPFSSQELVQILPNLKQNRKFNFILRDFNVDPQNLRISVYQKEKQILKAK